MPRAKVKSITIYTDGACSGNPGPGGWGALLISGKHEKEISGGEADTTNNRMELRAAIEALNTIKPSFKGDITLITDSVYVRDGITKWIHNWKKRGWKKADKKPVMNADLWKELDAAQDGKNVTWEWIKGHAGHEGNERADQLARDAVP